MYESFGYRGNLKQVDDVPIESFKYKKYCLPGDEEMNYHTHRLVPEQLNILRKVVHYCKDVVRAQGNFKHVVKPLRLIVHGGQGKLFNMIVNVNFWNIKKCMFLGVGKSAIIKAMSMHAEKILRKVGAKEDHPRVLLCAFTGKAASLIGKKLKKYI